MTWCKGMDWRARPEVPEDRRGDDIMTRYAMITDASPLAPRHLAHAQRSMGTGGDDSRQDLCRNVVLGAPL